MGCGARHATSNHNNLTVSARTLALSHALSHALALARVPAWLVRVKKKNVKVVNVVKVVKVVKVKGCKGCKGCARY